MYRFVYQVVRTAAPGLWMTMDIPMMDSIGLANAKYSDCIGSYSFKC